MKILEELGFIKSKESGNQQYKYVLLIHPTLAVQRLYEKGLVPQNWWDTYRPRQIEATEASYEKLMDRHKPAKSEKVVSIKAAKTTGSRRSEHGRPAAINLLAVRVPKSRR